MKKCFMILGVLIALIIPISNVDASFDVQLKDNTTISFPDLPSNVADSNFIILRNTSGQYQLWPINYLYRDYALLFQYSNHFNLRFNWNREADVNNDEMTINGIYYRYENSNWVSYDYPYSLSGSGYFSADRFKYNQVVYSTVDLTIDTYNANYTLEQQSYYTFLPTSNLDLRNWDSSSNHFIIYYKNEVVQQDYLEYTTALANDLDGTDIRVFTITANNYNSNYHYQIKTEQENTWTDITLDLDNSANQYTYTLYYNTTLYMRVLDANNDTLEAKTHTVTDLNNYGLIITHNEASDSQDRLVNTIRIDSRTIYSDNYMYQCSYDNQTFYNMNITSQNKIFYLNHALNTPVYFRVLEGNNVVYTTTYNPDFSNMNKTFNVTESTEMINDEKNVKLTINLENYLLYSDMYNFRFIIDDIEYSEEQNTIEINYNSENYQSAVHYIIYVDNLEFKNAYYRIGTGGTSWGSDIGFDDAYENILEEELEAELSQDYSSIPNMVESVKKFLGAISGIVTTLLGLVMYFFNRLNIWIRMCIITLFIDLVISRVIKAVRR